MLPVVIDEPFDSPDHIYEVKWGGVRAIAVIDGDDVRLHGCNLRDLTSHYPELQSLTRCVSAKHAVIDGEIIAWGAEALPDVELLRGRLLQPDEDVPAPPRRSTVTYQVFDLLELDRSWLLRRPLYERRNLLHERLGPNRYVQVADFVREEGVAFFEAAVSYRLEGIVAKDKHSHYLPGQRSISWQEIRSAQSDDFVIGGYTFGGGLRKKDLISTILLGAYDRGQLHFIGEVSIGCSDREARQLLDMLAPLHTERAPFAAAPEIQRFLYWCRPELACHVRFSAWTPDGLLRFPVFVTPRPDVPPEECLREPLVATL